MRGRVLPRFLALALLVTSGRWPAHAAGMQSQADYSNEPAVVEQLTERITYSPDATQAYALSARIRVQSTAGLQVFGTLVVPYSRALSSVDVKFIRVRKPGGTLVETPAADAIDVPADITRAAPTYTDLYLKQFNVKGLAVGDTLEYEVAVRTQSLIPGQFWMAQRWNEDTVVLAQDFEVTVPAAVDLHVKTIGQPPAVETHQDVRTYRWHHANLTRLTGKALVERNYQRSLSRADVQLTSFRDWAQVGAALDAMWRDRLQPTPAIRDKALELTRGLTTPEEKLDAIYRFVATKIRYVAVSFGIGRLQPHAAADVLENGFGDCKDKHALLSALLSAAGIRVEPAFIGPGEPFDAEVPSPDQFTHVITTGMLGASRVWLDTTLEVAPVGLLIQAERDRNVLLIPEGELARLIKTPESPSRENSWRTESIGTIDDKGTLDADVRETLAGDVEVMMRMALRSTPQSQWPDLVTSFPLPQRFGGSVSDIVVSPLEDTTMPLAIAYRYHAANFSEWDKQRVSAAVPGINYTPAPGADGPAVPIQLGGPMQFVATSRLTLPEGYTATLGATTKPEVDVQASFARYRMRNTVKGRVFETSREMLVTAREVALAEFDSYRKFLSDFIAADYVIDVRRGPWSVATTSRSRELRK